MKVGWASECMAVKSFLCLSAALDGVTQQPLPLLQDRDPVVRVLSGGIYSIAVFTAVLLHSLWHFSFHSTFVGCLFLSY